MTEEETKTEKRCALKAILTLITGHPFHWGNYGMRDNYIELQFCPEETSREKAIGSSLYGNYSYFHCHPITKLLHSSDIEGDYSDSGHLYEEQNLAELRMRCDEAIEELKKYRQIAEDFAKGLGVKNTASFKYDCYGNLEGTVCATSPDDLKLAFRFIPSQIPHSQLPLFDEIIEKEFQRILNKNKKRRK